MKGSMKVVYENEDRYEGGMKDGKRHGKGAATFSNGHIYTEKWKNDVGDWEFFSVRHSLWPRDGNGTETLSIGHSYTGKWKNDAIHGKGRMEFTDAEVYEGEWKANKFHGKGTLKESDGSVYEGDFVNDACTGRGTYKDADGVVYEGQFVNGKSQGSGKETYTNGDVYEGEWKNAKYHGRGTFKYADGHVYQGEWEDGEKNGKGIETDGSGNEYEGKWEHGKKHGQGTRKRHGDEAVYTQVHSQGKLLSSNILPTAINEPPPKRSRGNKKMKSEVDSKVSQAIKSEETDEEDFAGKNDGGKDQDSTGPSGQQITNLKSKIESLENDLASIQARIESLKKTKRE